MKLDLATYNNDWYKPGSVIKRFLWHYINLFFFRSGLFPFYAIKTFLLKLFGATVGSNVLIKPHVSIKYPWLLQIGNNVWIGEEVWIDNLAQVTIGNNVCISQGALLLCGNHDYTKTTFDLIVKPIVIEEGVWLCAKSVVCCGVVCAQHSILSTSSTLSSSTLPFGIYQGTPAKMIKTRTIS